MRLTAANLLTLSRLLLAPVFLVLFLRAEYGWALAVFAIAGATDLVDGTVARLLKQHSTSGALLDPVADKLLVQSCFLALAWWGAIPWWFAGLALVRDLMIVSGIFYLEHIHAPLPYRPTLVSKFATLVQLIVAVLGLVRVWRPDVLLWGVPAQQALFGAVLIAAALILASGIMYIAMGCSILRAHRAQHA